MKNNIKLFGFIFWLHLSLNLISCLSPFLFSWQIIILFILFLHIQFYLIGGCVLNKFQFKKNNITFLFPYLKMMGFKINLNKTKFIMRYLIPIIIFSIAFTWQIIFKKSPLLF